jgi:hypothetical protein
MLFSTRHWPFGKVCIQFFLQVLFNRQFVLMRKDLIAPCGMNCRICMVYLREKNKCPGCRGDHSKKPVTRIRCKIKTCMFFLESKAKYCFECDKVPCDALKHLDKRYRTRYNMSMIENLENIRKSGIRKFIKSETTRWACPKCNGVICVHNRKCYTCE